MKKIFQKRVLYQYSLKKVDMQIPKMIVSFIKFYFKKSVEPKILSSDIEIDKNLKDGTFQSVCNSLSLSINDYQKHKLKSHFDKIQKEIDQNENLKETIESKHPVLHQAANYYFEKSGKKTRPFIVLLLSYATCFNRSELVISNQKRLSDITEMIHVASLIHDDIIDDSDTRRGEKALHLVHSNKIAVLAGDFLLSRASVSLTKLGDIEVNRLLSTVIEHLAHGEIWQMASIGTLSFEDYLMKSFLKTASLIASSCEATTRLANCKQEIQEASFNFGKHLGLSYQLIDDSLDFTSKPDLLGKPSFGADLKLGLATAPVHFAAQEYPELIEMISRKFEKQGDVEKTLELVQKSKGIEKTKLLAATHCKKAIENLLKFEPSQYRDSLIYLTGLTLERDK